MHFFGHLSLLIIHFPDPFLEVLTSKVFPHLSYLINRLILQIFFLFPSSHPIHIFPSPFLLISLYNISKYSYFSIFISSISIYSFSFFLSLCNIFHSLLRCFFSLLRFSSPSISFFLSFPHTASCPIPAFIHSFSLFVLFIFLTPFLFLFFLHFFILLFSLLFLVLSFDYYLLYLPILLNLF